MRLKSWQELPQHLQTEAVKPYYESLRRKRGSLFCKRLFDVVCAVILLVVLAPVFLVLSLWIKLDSHGTIFFRQVRVTQYGREFRIFKFRTMVINAELIGAQVTVQNDNRITRAGVFLRKCRLDEIPQLFNVLMGDMTFVGTRPEVPKYVATYTEEMLATLLLPAGVTSLASITYKEEETLITEFEHADKTYVENILPQKMVYNLYALSEFNFLNEFSLLIHTIIAVIKRPDKQTTDKKETAAKGRGI